ncbi:MAG: homocysteine S-methyltransferase family protein [Oscillospiraceae bacterium]|nr:homocysteine S-methyltransferase family protein [Oscillospiraceae bacterium]
MDIVKRLRQSPLLYDGSKGVILGRMGLGPEECGETWNVTRPDMVRALHRDYVLAGSDIIQTNTFSGGRTSLLRFHCAAGLYDINYYGVKLARTAAEDRACVAASIGPTGEIMEPVGDMSFDEALELFREQAVPLRDAGADVLHFETFGDITEMRAAIIAAKECCDSPIFATMTFTDKGSTFMGNSPEACAVICEGMGAAAVGANCSMGPDGLIDTVRRMSAVTALPLIAKANAGMPRMENGQTVYDLGPEEFASYTSRYIDMGVRLIGGCCGASPEYIKAIARELKDISYPPMRERSAAYIASPRRVLDINSEYEVGRVSYDGDVDELLDALDEVSGDCDCILIDLNGGEDIDPGELAMELGSVREPLIFENGGETLLQLLRYYPGRAGIRDELPGAEFYGAVKIQ